LFDRASLATMVKKKSN